MSTMSDPASWQGSFAVNGSNLKDADCVKPAPRFTLLGDDECWRQMPQPVECRRGPIPNWAKAVAVYAPRTAAAMLALDYAQRTQSPLDAKLRAKLRWVISRANRCNYGMAYAAGDMLRAGGSQAELQLLAQPDQWPTAEADALQFVWDLTCHAPSVTDEQFADLVNHFGEKQAAAMVLLAAYGNFQDRLTMALNLPIEEGGPLPPLCVRFDGSAFSHAPPPQPRSTIRTLPEPDRAPALSDPHWSALDYETLQARLASQRQRKARLPIPSWEQVQSGLPAEYPATRPVQVVWNLMCLGYVPELSIPWSIATRTFWAETQQDRVFEETLFWVQTRVLECNYCMGHCEMLLETAGMEPAEVRRRIKYLVNGDWTGFLPEEHLALAFACLLTKSPWDVNDGDIDAVKRELGQRRAMYTIWWLARGLYMTRVSDGFQLPLERDNVFRDFFPPPHRSGRESNDEPMPSLHRGEK